jgi:uncharacterized protein (TIGR02145 family)
MESFFKIILVITTMSLINSGCKKKQIIETTIETPNPKQEFGTVVDVDSNVYKTVKVGNQWWFAENLRTSHFNNGDTIPYNKNWNSNSTWAWYNNDSTLENPYGKLYNGYVVTDSRNVCPTGWRIPSEDDWNELTNFLGGSKNVAVKLKSTYGWNEDGNGTNESGMNLLPGGSTSNSDIEKYGYWWSNYPLPSNTPGSLYYRYLIYNSSSLNSYYVSKSLGFSIRCISF